MSETPTPTPPPAPSGSETPPEGAPVQLPDDHPLVKTLAEQKKAIKDLKTKAQRLDELEDAQKSETEKAADRIAKAEAEVATLPTKVSAALREHLVTLHEIDKDDAELFLTADDPDVLLKQVTRLLGQSDKRKRNHRVPTEGKTTPKPGEDKLQTFTRNLFGRDD